MTRLAALLAAVLAVGGCSSMPRSSSNDPDVPMTPAAALPNTQLGVEYMQRGQNTLALQHFRRALQQDPKLPQAHNAIAVLYQRLGNDELAETHFGRAVQLAPDDADARHNFGSFLCARDRFTEAEAQFVRALGNPLYEAREKTLTNLGICTLRAGDRGRGEGYIRSALDEAPKYAPALWQLAQLSWEQGEPLKTRAFLQRYHAAAAVSPESLLLGVLTERKLGDPQAALRYAAQLRSEFPGSGEARRLQEMDGS